MNRRRHPYPRLELERLEPRMLLVGFYDGPASIPIGVALQGSAAGTAIVQSTPPGRGTLFKVAAAGRIKPEGLTTISGSLRINGGIEHGTLVFESAKSSQILDVSGPAPQGSANPSTTTLPFTVTGRTVVPNTLFSYVPTRGRGTVTVTVAPGAPRGRLTLVFEPS